MTYRNRKLLDLAHDMRCTAQFEHPCNDYNGCVPAHSDMLIFGRGSYHKAPDWAFAAVCPNAHKEIDPKLGPSMNREQRQTEWMRAFVETQNRIWDEKKVRVV